MTSATTDMGQEPGRPVYLPPHFREERLEVLEAVVREAPLGVLATVQGGLPMIDHIPMSLRGPDQTGRRSLVGHVARANPIVAAVAAGADVRVVFGGVDHYVTPSWYATKRQDGRVVPTWNYSVVHVEGKIRWYSEPERLHALVSELTDEHEASRDKPWAVTDAPADYIATMLRAIIGFEITITSMVGKFKNSQNRNEADRAGVRAGLAVEGLAPAVVDHLVKPPRSSGA